MAYGLTSGWTAAEPDVRTAGRDEWAAMTGVPATHPLVGGPHYGGSPGGAQGPDMGFSRAVLSDPLAASPAAPADVAAKWDDWRDAFDPDSPAFWILLLILAAVGFVFFRVEGRLGPARAGVSLGK
jgi:hypothetical protein